MSETGVEWARPPWADKGITLNHQLGCKHAGGPGCDHCWAETDTWIRQHNTNPKMAAANAGLVVMRDNGRPRWTGKFNLLPQRFAEPFKTRQRWGIFTPSKSDPWYEPMMATEEGRKHTAAAIGLAAVLPQHTVMVLSKRTESGVRHQEWIYEQAARLNLSPVRFCAMMLVEKLLSVGEHKIAARVAGVGPLPWPIPNLWVLTSTENQECLDKRLPWLLRLEMAGVLGLSAEPLLGPLVLPPEALGGYPESDEWARTGPKRPRLGWVIAGGESGNGNIRPMHPAWARGLRDQCVAAGVPYFFKQWGAWSPCGDDWTHVVFADGEVSDRATVYREVDESDHETILCTIADCDGEPMRRVGKGKAGNTLDGQTWEQFPPDPLE